MNEPRDPGRHSPIDHLEIPFTVTSAFAAEYYVVRDATTKKCTIVDTKPTTNTTVVVGDGKVFKTRTEAETGMKTIKVCAH